MGIIVPVLTFVFLLFTTVFASNPRMILVGGYVGSWKIPDSPNNPLNYWAENNRFKVGDFLVFKYDNKVDSVLQVSKEDYESCNTAKPLKEHNNGDTKVKLGKSGPYFFISGAPGNCAKGEKITLVVLSERKSDKDDSPKVSPVTSPAPSPSPNPSPAPAPAATHNDAVGLTAGGGFMIAVVTGLAMAMIMA